MFGSRQLGAFNTNSDRAVYTAIHQKQTKNLTVREAIQKTRVQRQVSTLPVQQSPLIAVLIYT